MEATKPRSKFTNPKVQISRNIHWKRTKVLEKSRGYGVTIEAKVELKLFKSKALNWKVDRNMKTVIHSRLNKLSESPN